MTKRIVYIHPGDMVEFRFCSLDEPACAGSFKAQSDVMQRPTTIRFEDRYTLEVFDPYVCVFNGSGTGRRQMLTGS